MSHTVSSFLLRSTAIALAVCLAATLAACTVFKSHLDSDEPGLRYFLPRTLLKVDIAPYGYPADKVVAELNEEQKDRADRVGNIRVSALIEGRQFSVLVDKAGKLVEPLFTGLQLSVAENGENDGADTGAGLTLQYQPSTLSTDKVCIGVDQTGLLAFAEAQVKDESGDIIVSIAKLAGRLIGPAAFATPADNPNRLVFTDYKLTLTIDPLKSEDREHVGHAIDKQFPQFKGQYRFEAEDAEHFLPRHHDDHHGKKVRCPEEALCYRTRAPMRLALRNRATGSQSITYANVVNRSVTHHISVTRAFLVEKITRLGFEKGALSYVKIDKPSETLAAAKLPLTIYDAVLTSALAAPGQFLGQLTPGIKPDLYKTIIDGYKEQLTAVTGLQTNLATLRNGDLTTGTGRPPAFTVSCKKD